MIKEANAAEAQAAWSVDERLFKERWASGDWLALVDTETGITLTARRCDNGLWLRLDVPRGSKLPAQAAAAVAVGLGRQMVGDADVRWGAAVDGIDWVLPVWGNLAPRARVFQVLGTRLRQLNDHEWRLSVKEARTWAGV